MVSEVSYGFNVSCDQNLSTWVSWVLSNKKILAIPTCQSKYCIYAIYFASLIFRESGLQDIFASG